MPVDGKPDAPGRDVVVLTDETGRERGLADKVRAHQGDGLLHRAITCLLFDDDNRLLFARRALGKLLWPGYWDATVATHPAPGETDLETARRRVPDELGAEVVDLICPTVLVYHARYDDHWSEREHCAVLVGRLAGRALPVAGQIDDVRAVAVDQVAAFLESEPVAPWFALAWQLLQTAKTQEMWDWLA
ncbi:MAG: isopentenyl-diphosphate Delta-isomerase [bacterium]|nr:isopentenyl-diphosphate Delta-isomerase [bacterium]